jgi:hypothetical protein
MRSLVQQVAGHQVALQQGGQQLGVLHVLLGHLLHGVAQGVVFLFYIDQLFSEDGLRIA